jgi:hypothetical protein
MFNNQGPELDQDIISITEKTRAAIEETSILKEKDFVLVCRKGSVSLVDLEALLKIYKKYQGKVDKE